MTERVDCLVIGAGVFGLWSAHALAAEGRDVVIADAGEALGAGASGGVVGALTPHMPSGWRPFKAFQFRGLATLEARVAALGEATGLDAGYRRRGRVSPLDTPDARARALAEAEAARRHWHAPTGVPSGVPARFIVHDTLPARAGALLPPGAAPHGAIEDTLSAAIMPRRLLAALAAALAPATEIRFGWRLGAIDPARMAAEFDRGTVAARTIVLAAGHASLGALPDAAFADPGRRGSGVKGQAALLACDPGSDCPLVQGRGLYIVPHADGSVAVGSTSERKWTAPGTDEALDALIARAVAAAPALAGAPVVERWTGIRPRAPGPEPLIGPLPGAPGVILATGGYKIGFGIAHLAGDAVAAFAAGRKPDPVLPEATTPAAHGLSAPDP